MVSIEWSALALDDLKSIHDYIARDSIQYAKHTVLQIMQRVSTLRKFPQAGRVVPEFAQESLRELIQNNYRIVYRLISNHQVQIVRVHHAARDIDALT